MALPMRRLLDTVVAISSPRRGSMSYVDSVLQPGERIIMRGHLHWIVYWHAILFFVLHGAVSGLGR